MSGAGKSMAVLYADFVGYSILEALDADKAKRFAQSLREAMQAEVAAGDGEVADASEEGAVAVFASAGSAVACAERIHRRVAARNEGQAPDDRFEIIMGIALGEVAKEGGDLVGLPVRVAVAAHTMADPGGYALDEAAWKQVRSSTALRGTLLKPRRFPNLQDPVRVFVVPPPGAGYMGWLIRKRKMGPTLVFLGVLVLAGLVAGGWLALKAFPGSSASSGQAPEGPSAPARAEVVVDDFEHPYLFRYDGGQSTMTFFVDSTPTGGRIVRIVTAGTGGWWGVVDTKGPMVLSGYDSFVIRARTANATGLGIMIKDNDEVYRADFRLTPDGGPTYVPFASFKKEGTGPGDGIMNWGQVKEMHFCNARFETAVSATIWLFPLAVSAPPSAAH
jgi:class 3 adenylate cyclase